MAKKSESTPKKSKEKKGAASVEFSSPEPKAATPLKVEAVPSVKFSGVEPRIGGAPRLNDNGKEVDTSKDFAEEVTRGEDLDLLKENLRAGDQAHISRVVDPNLEPKLTENPPIEKGLGKLKAEKQVTSAGTQTGAFTFDTAKKPQKFERTAKRLNLNEKRLGRTSGKDTQENKDLESAVAFAKSDQDTANASGKKVNGMIPGGNTGEITRDSVYGTHHHHLATVGSAYGLDGSGKESLEKKVRNVFSGAGADFSKKLSIMHEALSEEEASKISSKADTQTGDYWEHPITKEHHLVASNHPDMPSIMEAKGVERTVYRDASRVLRSHERTPGHKLMVLAGGHRLWKQDQEAPSGAVPLVEFIKSKATDNNPSPSRQDRIQVWKELTGLEKGYTKFRGKSAVEKRPMGPLLEGQSFYHRTQYPGKIKGENQPDTIPNASSVDSPLGLKGGRSVTMGERVASRVQEPVRDKYRMKTDTGEVEQISPMYGYKVNTKPVPVAATPKSEKKFPPTTVTTPVSQQFTPKKVANNQSVETSSEQLRLDFSTLEPESEKLLSSGVPDYPMVADKRAEGPANVRMKKVEKPIYTSPKSRFTTFNYTDGSVSNPTEIPERHLGPGEPSINLQPPGFYKSDPSKAPLVDQMLPGAKDWGKEPVVDELPAIKKALASKSRSYKGKRIPLNPSNAKGDVEAPTVPSGFSRVMGSKFPKGSNTSNLSKYRVIDVSKIREDTSDLQKKKDKGRIPNDTTEGTLKGPLNHLLGGSTPDYDPETVEIAKPRAPRLGSNHYTNYKDE